MSQTTNRGGRIGAGRAGFEARAEEISRAYRARMDEANRAHDALKGEGAFPWGEGASPWGGIFAAAAAAAAAEYGAAMEALRRAMRDAGVW